MPSNGYNDRMIRRGQAPRDFESERRRRIVAGEIDELRSLRYQQHRSEEQRKGMAFVLAALAVIVIMLIALLLMPRPAGAAPREICLPAGVVATKLSDEEESRIVALRAWLARERWARAKERVELGRRYDCAELGERLALWASAAYSAVESQAASPTLRCQSLRPDSRQCLELLDPQPASSVDFTLRDFIAGETHSRYPGRSLEECEAFADACVGFDDALWWCSRGWAESSACSTAKGPKVWWTVKGRRLSGHCSGWWQIHPMHAPRMASLGLDYESEADRTEFARVLSEDRGDRPWSESNGNARRFLRGLKQRWEQRQKEARS